ncbi:MAG: hypothetical protein KAU27_15745, partial [Desulfuromonadales bacterium]|nr:hypothetical protein [Desulfuromonadales bacterium]
MSKNPIKIRLKAAATLHRAWRLVWLAAPRWTLVNLLVMLVQAVLPLVALVLLKQIVDSLSIAIANPGEGSFFQVGIWIGLAGLVALLTTIVNSLGGYAAEAQSLAVTDHVADV